MKNDKSSPLSISEAEIQANLEKAVGNLDRSKASTFLTTVARILGESVDSLRSSIDMKDVDLCKQYAHKLKGSSNLYGSKILLGLLIEAESTPESFLKNETKHKTLMNEFELVLKQVNLKLSKKLIQSIS